MGLVCGSEIRLSKRIHAFYYFYERIQFAISVIVHIRMTFQLRFNNV